MCEVEWFDPVTQKHRQQIDPGSTTLYSQIDIIYTVV